MVLLGSPECKLTRVANLTRTPVWAFHATEDDNIPSHGIAQTIDTLQKSGGTAQLTMIEANYHNCWAVAFRDNALLDWLLSQKRNSTSSRAPGVVLWTWQQWALQAFLPCVVIVAVANELKRQRRRQETNRRSKTSTALSTDAALLNESPSSNASMTL